MTTPLLRARWLLSALLVVSAGLFAIGVTAERNADHDHHHREAEAHVEGGEAAEHAEHAERTEVGGVPLAIGAVAVSLVLAGLVWFRRERGLLFTVAGFSLLFAALDLAELARQVDEHRAAIAVIAALVAVLHLLAGFVARTRAVHRPAA